MAIVFYISHPEIVIDPDILVPNWSLSKTGVGRLASIADTKWVAEIDTVFTSPETKAIETAQLIAEPGCATPTILPKTGEIDRSATGYVPHERHEELADLCFANPSRSTHGWERAIDAQNRICTAIFSKLENANNNQTFAFVGHGGVGTLLACKLGGVDISRRHDQKRSGSVFAFEWPQKNLLFSWVPMEKVQDFVDELFKS